MPTTPNNKTDKDAAKHLRQLDKIKKRAGKLYDDWLETRSLKCETQRVMRRLPKGTERDNARAKYEQLRRAQEDFENKQLLAHMDEGEYTVAMEKLKSIKEKEDALKTSMRDAEDKEQELKELAVARKAEEKVMKRIIEKA